MPIKSKSAIATGDGHFLIDFVDVAEPKATEVVVKIKAAGLCHTDYDSLSWGKPIVMGHEGAGIVVKVGANVDRITIGDQVLLNWATPCLKCFQCLQNNQHLCENNSPVVAGANGYTNGHAHLDGTKWRKNPIERSFNLGTLSEYALVQESALVKVSGEPLHYAAASILSCGVMTGYGSVINAAKVKATSSVVVLGCGGVGLNVIQAAKIAGAAKIIAIDIKKEKLEWAKQFGATHTLLADKNDNGLLEAAKEVMELCDKRGADYAFECTAIPSLGAAPLAMVRNAGCAVQVSGIEEEITIDMRLFEWDKTYINPLYGKCNPQKDFPILIKQYREGSLKLDEMITKQYKLEDLKHAFADMLNGKNAKGVVVFD